MGTAADLGADVGTIRSSTGLPYAVGRALRNERADVGHVPFPGPRFYQITLGIEGKGKPPLRVAQVWLDHWIVEDVIPSRHKVLRTIRPYAVVGRTCNV